MKSKVKAHVKEKNYKVQVVNIKLRSNDRSGAEMYSQIVLDVHRNKIFKTVRGNTALILRTLFKNKVQFNDTEKEVFTGKISTFTLIDGKEWLNLDKMEKDNVELPRDMFPNLRETDYFFFPELHRFVIVTQPYLSINSVQKFLKSALGEVIKFEEELLVNVEQDEDVFDRITRAQVLKKLQIEISYSNGDTGDESKEFIEKQLRGSRIGKIKMNIDPDCEGNINSGSTFIKGSLEVAQSNGYVIANIENNGEKERIDTSQHPRVIALRAQETMVLSKVMRVLYDLFRK